VNAGFPIGLHQATGMMCRFFTSQHKPRVLTGGLVGLATLIMAGDPAAATSRRHDQPPESVQSRAAGTPLMAIVSLRHQRITVYDAEGWILRAPVSSGQKGYETPAGIFSIIQKEAEHYSNLYDDAFMPHMQRITWSGIALHGGVLPGHPASHGCVRMPYGFAERLFDATKLGMRVIVAPNDVTPVEIDPPALFKPRPLADAGAPAGADPAVAAAPPHVDGVGPARPTLRSIAAARVAEAQEAARKADEARLAAAQASTQAARAMMPVRVAENLRSRAEAQLKAADAALAAAGTPEAKEQAEAARTQAQAKVAELEAQVAAAKAEAQPKADAVAPARAVAMAAEAARVAAAEAAREAERKAEPVSVFISRKSQRLYVRQTFQPVLESAVTIQDADRPIGTHIFTAVDNVKHDADLRWSVVSLDGGRADAVAPEPHRPGPGGGRDGAPIATDLVGARAALERITIPQDVLDRLSEMMSPRSSLIISDEAASPETGRGTDFVILMSGEPQGGIKMRHHSPEAGLRYPRMRGRVPYPYWGVPFGGPFSSW
jgi:hypothetical protein